MAKDEIQEFTLGSDVYLPFTVTVNKRPALITNTTGELYHNEDYMRNFTTRHSGCKVSGLIDGKTFKTVGDYIAKFNVFLDAMGKHEYAIKFKITQSVLGKKRLR